MYRVRGRVLVALLALAAVSASVSAQDGRAMTPGERFLEAHQKAKPTEYFGEPITLSVKDADLVELLRSFATIGDFNLVLDPSVQGKVTVELRDVPWDQALEQILKIHNLGMEVTGSKVRVGPDPSRTVRRQPGSAPVTVYLTLRYADPEVVAGALHRPEIGVPGEGGHIRVAEDGRLEIRDLRSSLRGYGRVMKRIDVPSAVSETPEDLAARCVELWDQLVPPRPVARIQPRPGN